MAAQQAPLRTCDPNFNPTVASRSHPAFTPRRAVDSTGRIGSLYDASCDQVLDKQDCKFNMQSVYSRRPAQCFIKKVKLDEFSNLLELINLHAELRLSVTLHMGQEMGVGALINYSGSLDKYTRLICYTYYSRTDYLPGDEFIRLSKNKSALFDTPATHVIVLVNWGIDAVAVVQLPCNDDDLTSQFDQALDAHCKSLCGENIDKTSLEKEKNLLETIGPIEVFSNMPALTRIKSIIDFYRDIPQVKQNTHLLKPYNYNLCAIETIFVINSSVHVRFRELENDYRCGIEVYLLKLSRDFKKLGRGMTQDYPNFQRYLEEQFSNMRKKWSNLQAMYVHEIQRVQNLVTSARRGNVEQIIIPEMLNDHEKEELKNNVAAFANELNGMQHKENLINDLSQKHFEYWNAADCGMKQRYDERIIRKSLSYGDKHNRAICFSDKLYKKDKEQWDRLIAQSINELKENPALHVIYVDFTYCSYKLKNFIILTGTNKNNDETSSNSKSCSASASLLKPIIINDDTINIVLLGESGVGKSTFINAFVNYLLFNTLEQAKNKSVVLIPVSFIITTGDDFQEQIVKFGETNELNNEDHDHPGQSVTQHCRSYVFTLNDGRYKGKKLRIIDTPGIGDVRGLVQDDINMQHVLSYINNLTHLNAVCILMKPNNARLNILFRTCFMQLFDLLGEKVSERVIFCFTNSRATFYAPGNTAPLLKNMLQALPGQPVPFAKNNTFCFDSESFRYLVAVKNGIQFGEYEEVEYTGSWVKSSDESKRFIEYIYTSLATPVAPSQTKSVKGAQLKISIMIRPILETLRNTVRNLVLYTNGSSTKSIELCPKPIQKPSAICMACQRQSTQVHQFWIMNDELHVFHNECRKCEHQPKEHYAVDYELEYKLYFEALGHSDADIRKIIDDLCETSAKFAYFLIETTNNVQNDLFLSGIERMIKEEDDICRNRSSDKYHSSLLHLLKELKRRYEEMKMKLSAEKKQISLTDIYEKLKEMHTYEMIKRQVAAAEEWQKFMIKYYEHEVTAE